MVGGGEDHVRAVPVVVFAFDRFGGSGHGCYILASITAMDGLSAALAMPSLKVTNFPEIAGTLSPGTMMPTRLSGSAAEIVIAEEAIRFDAAACCLRIA